MGGIGLWGITIRYDMIFLLISFYGNKCIDIK